MAATKTAAAAKSAARKPATKATATQKTAATPAQTQSKKTTAPKKTGRPRKVTDEEILTVLLEEPSPSKAAAILGVHRNTITSRLKDPELRELLTEHRRRAVEAATLYLADKLGFAVRKLVELAEDSGPQDSVQLGATMSLIKVVRDLTKHDVPTERPDEVWESPPRFNLRLVKGGLEDNE